MIEGTLLILATLSIIGFYPIISIIKQHNEDNIRMIRPILAYIPVLSSFLAILIVVINSIHKGREVYKEAKNEYWKFKDHQNDIKNNE